MVLKKQPKFKKILIMISNTFLVLLIVIGIFVGITLLPIKNNIKLLAVVSGSMEPAIGVGSLAVVKPVSDYRVNDIITFKSTNSATDRDMTTHRIVAVLETDGEKNYTTKGDANNAVDSRPVNQGQVVGKYFFNIALLGYLLKYIKTLPGLLLIIIVPAVIIIYEEARKIGREMRAIRDKKKLNKSPKKETK